MPFVRRHREFVCKHFNMDFKHNTWKECMKKNEGVWKKCKKSKKERHILSLWQSIKCKRGHVEKRAIPTSTHKKHRLLLLAKPLTADKTKINELVSDTDIISIRINCVLGVWPKIVQQIFYQIEKRYVPSAHYCFMNEIWNRKWLYGTGLNETFFIEFLRSLARLLWLHTFIKFITAMKIYMSYSVPCLLYRCR